MIKAVSHRLLFIALLVCAISPAEARADNTWTRVESQNFVLIGDASEKDIRRVATKLEQFREVFKTLFPRMRFVSPVPTTVIVFRSEKSFRPYKPVDASGKVTKWVAGYFQPGEDRNYIALSTEGETQQTYTTIFHEYVHLLMENSFGRSNIPPWFNEGIAEYYDQFEIEDDQKVKLGNLNQNHLYTLQRTKLIPFEQFLKIDHYSLAQQGDHSANVFYAQSWAFMHYLLHGNNGARRDQVAAFLRELVAGKEVRPAFESVFGTTFAAMEKELRNYVERRTFVGTLVTLRAKLTFDATMRSAPMTEHSAKSVLGDLLYRKNRLDEAEAHLREALAAEPDSAVANASLGMVRMRQNKFSEARSLLEKAIAKDSSGHLVHYYYAYIISRESFGPGNMVDGFSDEAAAKMRTALKKAIQISPEFPESYSLLAFISLVRNDEIDEAVKYIEQALKLSPGNQNYQLHLAGLYMRRREFDRARSLAQAVHRAASDQEIRVRAESVLQNIQSFSEFVEAVKSTGPQGPPRLGRTAVTAEDREPTAEEIAKMRARAQLEVINEALRNPRSGEKRLLGYLSKIECTRSGVIYTVKSGSDILKLRSKDFQELDLMTYVPEFNGEFGCDGPAAEVFAVLTYLVAEDAKTKTAGQLLAIEVVPKDFEFIEPQN